MDFLKEGWKIDEHPEGTGFFGIGHVIAPSGSCYRDRIYFGELNEGQER